MRIRSVLAVSAMTAGLVAGIGCGEDTGGRARFRFSDEDTIENDAGQQLDAVGDSESLFVEDGECGDSVTLDGSSRIIDNQTVLIGIYRQRLMGWNDCQVEDTQTAYVESD